MTKIELVFIPSPLEGHLPSTIELAKLIVERYDNITILIMIYEFAFVDSTRLKSYIETQSNKLDPNRITFIILPPPSSPPDPSTTNCIDAVIQLQKPLVEQALEFRGATPAAFVLDLLNISLIEVANKMHVPSYVYFTSGANFLISLFHFQTLAHDHGMKNIAGLVSDPDMVFDLPGYKNPIPVNAIPTAFLDKWGDWCSHILNITKRIREAKGILVNTFLEFESVFIRTLEEQDNVPTIYPVGPLLTLHGPGDSKPSNKNMSEKKDDNGIMVWLDEQPRFSVVFLCFGSMGVFEVDQIKEMAHGIDRSGHRFLWSLRKPNQSSNFGVGENEIYYEALPEGFLDRIAHKGKIVEWVPQISILAHPAVGGFVTHCGWNSILESVNFGVPMATWPLHSEQNINAFALVKEFELAVEITLDFSYDFINRKGNRVVTAKEVENGINKLMNMDSEMRRKQIEVGDASKRALLTDVGSSSNFLSRFIEEVTQSAIHSLAEKVN